MLLNLLAPMVFPLATIVGGLLSGLFRWAFLGSTYSIVFGLLLSVWIIVGSGIFGCCWFIAAAARYEQASLKWFVLTIVACCIAGAVSYQEIIF